MYNPLNFSISLNTGSLIKVITGGTTSLEFSIKNNDPINTLYNLSFQIILGNGIELIDSTIPYTSVSGNIYSFTNIKDLAPLEIDYKFNIVLKLNTTTSNGNIIPFGSTIPCSFTAMADTMPRGVYDNNNEIIQSTASFSIEASKYIIYKINPGKLLLGKTYSSKIIIKTAENSSIFFQSIEDILGNGIKYLGNLIIRGYSSSLINVQIISPDILNNSFKLLFTNILIPENTTVEIEYDVKTNERYYLNGSEIGAYIENSTSITNKLSWSIDGNILSNNYLFVVYEIILEIVLSNYNVDINEGIRYSIYFYANLYHDLLNLSGYLNTTDGQILSDTSIPMYTSKNISLSGNTQITWNVGQISRGTSVIVTMDGNIGSKYIGNGLNIFAGDTFNATATCNAISTVNNNIISSSDSTNFKIGIPSVSKVITGYYYRDNTPKNYNILAPGDYISYKSNYNSENLSAPAKSVRIVDFYPYMTKNIEGISYEYSSTEYPRTNVLPASPYGALWFISNLPGNESFDINYKTQIDYVNISTTFPYNLFKLQLVNSNGISYSSRSQVGFSLGKPNLILDKNAIGNDINKVRIGETYSFISTLTNNNSNNNSTDAFNIVFTETIPSNVTLDTNSIIAKINGSGISSSIEGNLIVINISKLAPNDVFTLTYNVTINDTLGPNQSFAFTSSTTAPYTQVYDENNINLKYDVGTLTKDIILKSQNVLLSINSDTPTKIVGDIVYYTLDVTIPIGQKLSLINSSIFIPQSQTYSNEAWLNNNQISTTTINGLVVFPSISNIDATSSSIVYNYKIKCLVSNAIVSSQNQLQTIENYYGNLSYKNMLNVSSTVGISNLITIDHPHVDLNISSSSIINGFISPYIVGINKIIYTKVTASNLGSIEAKNIKSSITIPEYLNFNSVQSSSDGVNYYYNISNRILTMTVDNIKGLSDKYIILKFNILPDKETESKLIITGQVEEYYNNISTTKVYTSDVIYNNELYINSLISFLPLSFYSLIGSSSAINLSRLGESTKIEYILTNIGQGIDSYKIEMTPIKFQYDVYIGSTFIQTVMENSSIIITSPLLNNIEPGDSKYISFNYTIPLGSEEPLYGTMLVKGTSLINNRVTKTIPTTLQDP